METSNTNMVELILANEEKNSSDRISVLEKKIQQQNDEITCLKSALADCIRRVHQLENQHQQLQLHQSTNQIQQQHSPHSRINSVSSKSSTSIFKNHQLSKSDKKPSLSSSYSSQSDLKSSLNAKPKDSLKTSNEKLPNPTKTSFSRPQSAASTHEQQSHHLIFNKDAGMVKFYLRGRPITMYLPSSLQVSPESKDFGFNFDPNQAIAKPDENLKLEWVYGYRGKDCRSNLYQLPTGEIVYFIAAIAVLYNTEERTQRYYFGHTDDIKSMAIHPDKITIATGQAAGHDKHEGRAHVRIWDSVNLTTLKIIGLNANSSGFNEFQNSISCLSFSTTDSGEQLAIVDDAADRCLSVWNWQSCAKIATTKCYGDSVLNCEFHPVEKNLILTSGKQHLIFWHIDGHHLSKRSASFELAPNIQVINPDGSSSANTALRLDKPKYVLCITFCQNGDILTGDSDGNVLFWNHKEARINRVIRDAHDGGVFSLLLNETMLITGGKDGKISEWALDTCQRTGRQLQLPEQTGGCRFISHSTGSMFLIGTTKNCVFQANFDLNFMNCLTNGHSEELWGLASSQVHETNFLTCGNDKNLSYWDTLSHSLVWSTQLEDKLHCISTHPVHELAAIGFAKSKWIVYDLVERKVLFSQVEGNEQIECIQYSPNGLYIACGSRDNHIYVYGVSEDGQKYTRLGKCSGHSSFITHLDWSCDSECLMSNSGDHEILFWQASLCKQVTQVQVIREIDWQTNSCALSFNSLGIWNSEDSSLDGTDINACCVSASKSLLASVDDFGKVNLFRYPCSSMKVEKKSFCGHSSHVTNCSFVNNDTRLVTTGGNDMAVFQWSISKE